ncbi:glycosyltransferase family 39 protein [Candidatus Omnitrophota bacterium]
MEKNKLYIAIGLGIVFVAALIFRFYPVINNPEEINKGFGPFGDSNLYHCIAYNLYRGNGFSGIDDGTPYGLNQEPKTKEYEPAINRGPIYPTFIFLVYKFLGNPEDMKSLDNWHKNWNKIRLAQCVLDATICIFVFFIVRLIYPASLWPAFISAVLYAFSFYNIFYTKALIGESVTTFLLALAILFFTLSIKSGKKLLLFLAGVGFGLVVLSRTEYVLFILLLALYIFFVNRRSFSMAIKKGLIFIFGASIIIAPWVLRNYIVFKEPVITIGALGYNMHQGTFVTKDNWTSWGEYPEEIFSNDQEKEAVYSLYESFHKYYTKGSIKVKEFDDAFMELALKKIRDNPGQIFKIWITRIPQLWYQDYLSMYAYVEASGWFFVFYFMFAMLAFFISSGQERILMAPVGFLFVYLNLIFLPLLIEPRYGVALMPGIIALTGIGIWKSLLVLKSFVVKHKLIDFTSEGGD